MASNECVLYDARSDTYPVVSRWNLVYSCPYQLATATSHSLLHANWCWLLRPHWNSSFRPSVGPMFDHDMLSEIPAHDFILCYSILLLNLWDRDRLHFDRLGRCDCIFVWVFGNWNISTGTWPTSHSLTGIQRRQASKFTKCLLFILSTFWTLAQFCAHRNWSLMPGSHTMSLELRYQLTSWTVAGSEASFNIFYFLFQ